jgi:uncharacterized protein (DUF433 family)
MVAVRDGLDPELRRLGEQPRYALAEAARLGRLRPHTLRRWTRGYRYAGGLQPPVLRQASPAAGLSFFDLLEVVFLRAYRERGLSLQSIRRALDFTAENLSVDRPLLLKAFLHDGKDLFARFQSDAGEHGLINVSRRGQTAWPEVVAQYLEELDYEHDIAIRWWPEGRARNVLIDPRFEFGWPVVPSKNVRTELLAERWEAGERIAQIAADFDISEEEVEDALRYEQINYALAA